MPLSDKTITCTYEVGALLRPDFRNWLREAQAYSVPVEWKEGSGWLSRPFWVTTTSALHAVLAKRIGIINAGVDNAKR